MAYGLTFSEAKQRFTPVRGVPTAITCAQLITAWGDTAKPFKSLSFAEWQRKGGGPTINGYGYSVAKSFYDTAGDGAELWTGRITHLSSISNADSTTATKAQRMLKTAALAALAASVLGTVVGPWNLGSVAGPWTIIATIDALSPATATFTATAAARESGAGTYNLPNGATLIFTISGGATFTKAFSSGEFVDNTAATPAEVAASLNIYFLSNLIPAVATVTSGGTKVTLTTVQKGSGASVNITGGTANSGGTGTKLAFTTGSLSGTGNVANIAAVTGNEAKTVIEAAIAGCTVTLPGGALKIGSNTAGASSVVHVDASSSVDGVFGLSNGTANGADAQTIDRILVRAKWPGKRGESLQPKVMAASNGDSASFNLQILEDGIDGEKLFANLSMDPASRLYFETVVNDPVRGSDLVELVDQDNTLTDPTYLPDLVTAAALSGGDDGLSGLSDNDFSGSALGKTGLRAFDKLQQAGILISPERPTAALQNAAATYCEVTRSGRLEFIAGFAQGLSADDVKTYWRSTAALFELSEFIYAVYPPVKVANPSEDVFGVNVPTITVPVEGFVAGTWARIDSATPGGIWKAHAGLQDATLPGVLGLDNDEVLEDAVFKDLHFQNRINVVLKQDDTPHWIRGSMTAKSAGNFPDINARRGATFIQASLEKAYLPMLDQPIDDSLFQQMTRDTETFLDAQKAVGAFRAIGFQVDFGAALNPPSAGFAGQGFGRINIATKNSLEQLGIVIGQDLRDIEAELAAAAAA